MWDPRGKRTFSSLTVNCSADLYYLYVDCIAILRRKLPQKSSIFGHNNQRKSCEKLRTNQREVWRQETGSQEAAVQLVNTSLYCTFSWISCFSFVASSSWACRSLIWLKSLADYHMYGHTKNSSQGVTIRFSFWSKKNKFKRELRHSTVFDEHSLQL